MIRIFLAGVACLIASAVGAQSITTIPKPGRVPTKTEMSPAQIVINRADGLLYYVDAQGVPRPSSLVLATTTGKAAITAANAAALATAAGLGTTSAAAFATVTTTGQVASAGLTSSAQVKSTLAAGGSASALLASSAIPSIAWQATGQAADQKNWDCLPIGTTMYCRAVNDANSAATNWLTVNRGSGYTISSVAFGAPTLLQGYTVAGLPSCTSGLKGALAHVTDATSPTYNGALTGGGAVAVPAFCNGSAWTAH